MYTPDIPSGTSNRTFLYTIEVPSDANEAADRRGTGFADVINENLTVGVVYRFQPPNNSDTAAVWENYISNSFGAVNYRLDISGAGAMFAYEDVLINTATGLVQALPSRPYTADVAVTAVDSTGDTATVANWSFTAHYADTVTPAYGPNEADCTNGARVDITRYDESFSCNCSETIFTGENCEQLQESTAASSASKDDVISPALMYAVVGGLIGLLLVVLAVTRIQVYRARNKPVDMTALQDEIRGSLGMTAGMNVRPDEMGLTVTFCKSLENAFKASSHVQVEALARNVGNALLAELRQQCGLPPRLSDMFKQSDTTVSVDVDSATALVLMKVPADGTIKPANEELFASALQQRAARMELVVHGENYRHAVDEVSVAIPRRIPRELDRHSILRLGVLGEGNFGEVRHSLHALLGCGSRVVHTFLSTVRARACVCACDLANMARDVQLTISLFALVDFQSNDVGAQNWPCFSHSGNQNPQGEPVRRCSGEFAARGGSDGEC